MYVFDSSPFSALFKSFYRGRFPSLWARFDTLIDSGRIISTREVRRELERYGEEACVAWLPDHRDVFVIPTAEEGKVVAEIYRVSHFRQNIEIKKLQKGGLNADPFVIAKAKVEHLTVVTVERAPPNAARIPNICQHFAVPCINLEQFMERERWEF